MSKYKIIIPARKGSKGLPFKNRELFDYTIKSIPEDLICDLIVTTDDEVIMDKCNKNGIKYIEREKEFSDDESSMQDVMLDLNNKIKFKDNTIFIVLYLTYPQRKWGDVEKTLLFYSQNKCKSLLCKKEVKSSHPYLYMYDLGDNKGVQLVKHNLYRRQDYPKIFEISHFIIIIDKNELINLNKNLYNEDTFFYPIKEKIDIDTVNDLKEFKNGKLQ